MWIQRKQKDRFKDVPGPSPWYLGPEAKRPAGFKWSKAGDSRVTGGITLLLGSQGPVLALDFYNYVMCIGTSSLLIWHQRKDPKLPTQPIDLIVLDCLKLRPLSGSTDEICSRLRDRKRMLLYDGPPIAEASVPTTIVCEPRRMEFPPPLNAIPEQLILCQSSAIDSQPDGFKSNTAMAVIHPIHSTYELYPQDWFNNGGLDYGYQWITRLMRDPESQQIHGEGIRIDSFVLDNTLRQLAR